MGKLHRVKLGLFAILSLALSGVLSLAAPASLVSAAAEVGITPINNEIVLQPGQTYTSNFQIYNNGDEDLNYRVYVTPYAMTSDDGGNIAPAYDENTVPASYSTILDWISLDTDEGTLQAHENGKYVNYTINVPEDATPGGQYAAIMVEKVNDESAQNDGAGLTSVIRAAYIVYATVAGNLTETASISDVNVPGIFVDSKITASSMVENTGNVHGTASYALQVFPLFSDEEVYTNEEDPATQIIYPGTKYYNQLTWEDTPSIGIYRVVETVSLFGESTSTERIVVVCPLWLILVVVFAIVFIVVWLIVRSKKRKHNAGVQHA